GVRAADRGEGADRSRPEAAQAGGRGLGVHRAGLGRTQTGRHRSRAEDRRAPGAAAGDSRGERLGATRGAGRGGVIYEVFRQERKGQAFAHAGSVEAPNEEFAEAYAREQYGRRGEATALWRVPREAVHEIDAFADELQQ